jgi:hypothetical protein
MSNITVPCLHNNNYVRSDKDTFVRHKKIILLQVPLNVPSWILPHEQKNVYSNIQLTDRFSLRYLAELGHAVCVTLMTY